MPYDREHEQFARDVIQQFDKLERRLGRLEQQILQSLVNMLKQLYAEIGESTKKKPSRFKRPLRSRTSHG